MRIIGNIPHPDFRISVFHMNDKYIVKFEAGPMEQTFKFDQSTFSGVEAISKAIDEEFLKKVKARFNEMFLEMRRIGTAGKEN